MKTALKTMPLIGVLFAAACQTTSADTTVAAPTAAAASFSAQVASATCEDSIPERDNWLRSERPAVDAVVSSYQSRGIDPEDSSVFRAYRAFMNNGQDHDAAGAAYGTGYASAAACFA